MEYSDYYPHRTLKTKKQVETFVDGLKRKGIKPPYKEYIGCSISIKVRYEFETRNDFFSWLYDIGILTKNK
jgi:hypothetical protein